MSANQDFNREPPASSFNVDLNEVEKVWGTTFSSLSDLFSTRITVPGKKEPITVPTHMLGQSEETIRIIAYRSGTGLAQGPAEAEQEDLARFIHPGEVAISIKHHSPDPIPKPFEKLKFQCPHVQVAIGVTIKGVPGVITINQPKDYHKNYDGYSKHPAPLRLFGNPDYPMIFIKPRFPDNLGTGQKQRYVNNIRSWMLIANTFTEFPSHETYDGKDPIKTYSVENIKILGDKLLDAMTGNEEAIEWLRAEENKVYCSEFVHAALNLGIHYPLNKKMLGRRRYRRLRRELESGAFLKHNPNDFTSYVRRQTAHEDLQPITEAAKFESWDPTSEDIFDPRLATRLYTWADMLQMCTQTTIPRNELGESVAPLQKRFILEMKETMLKLFCLEDCANEDPGRRRFEQIYSEMVDVVERSYDNYEAFQNKLTPLTQQLRHLSRDLEKAVDYIITPNCYLVNASESIKGRMPGGILQWQYLGHGLHESILKPK